MLQLMDSPDRADLFANLKQGGKYEGTVVIYRHNSSADRVGVFDRALIGALPPGVKWIAHNGAGYDQIDVHACKEKGAPLLLALYPIHTFHLEGNEAHTFCF
jgi:glyoxylate reductase